MTRRTRVAIFNDTRGADGHFGCATVMENLLLAVEQAGMETTFLSPVGQDWREETDALPPPGAIDLVIVNGEGSIHSSERRSRAHYLAEVGALAEERYGAPSFLLNATLYDNAADLYRKLAHFDRIYVRDRQSLAEIEANGLRGDVIADLTLCFPRPAAVTAREGVGATDSVVAEVSIDIEQAARRHGWSFCPMATRKRSFPALSGLKSPRTWLRLLGAYLAPNDANAGRFHSHAAFMEWLESKAFVVTGRYHTVTLCLLTRTPFVAIASNTPKIESLLEDVFGDARRAFADIGAVEASDLTAFRSFSDGEMDQIAAFIAKAESKLSTAFADMAARARA